MVDLGQRHSDDGSRTAVIEYTSVLLLANNDEHFS